MAKKLGIAFLSLYLLQSNPAYSFGQTIEVHAKEQKLAKVFEQLKRENGYHFFWEGKDFSQTLITVDAKGDIHEVLDKLFSKLPLKYRIQQKTIIVEADPNKKIQESIYRGRVLNETGNPIQGATIIYDDGSGQKTVVTNAKGQFAFTAPQGPIHVIISSVGYQPQEYSVDNPEKSIFVQLELSNNRIEEVVISTGYQRINKINASGSTASLDSNYFKKRNNGSLEAALEGAVPGLSFYKDEKGNSDMRIRGGSSLRAGTQPLIIVDGFASSIIPNINEIEGVTVLKDAAAAAIWGSQASNGVIVITTKKGNRGKTSITYSGNLRVQMRPDYKALQRANSAEIIDYEKEQYDKEFVIDIYDGNSSGYTQSIGIFTAYDRKEISLEERDRRLAALAGLNNQEQINKLLLRKAINQSHYIGISGGSDNFRHMTTINGQFDLSGLQGTSTKTFNFSNRLQYDLAKFVSLTTNVGFLYGWDQQGMDDLAGEIRALQPYQMLMDEQGNYIRNYADYNKVENDRLMSLGYRDNGLNLYEENQLANNKSRSLAIRSLFGLNWKIMDGLRLTNNFVYERATTNGRNQYDKDSYATRSFMNRYTVLDKNNSIKAYIPYGDYLDTRSDQSTFLSTRNFLNYEKKFNEKHYINVLAGFDLNRKISEGDRNRLYGYNDQLLNSQNIDLIALNVGIKDWEGKTYVYDHSSYVRNNYVENREYSFYSTLAYTYDNRYTVTGSWRNDHSNLFGSDPKFKRTPLWSIGGKWLIDNEHFFDIDWISQLNLRATMGLTGNFDRSNQSSTYLVARRFFNATADDYVARVDNPPNAKLRWERTKTYNIGLDLGILKDRITLNADYYHKFSYDLLGSQDLDPTVGMTNSYINGADMINKGVEFGLNAAILKN
ncbi:MAG: SusC/RagA family TonB-linked outer membrane protein, partial [Sphingobacterium sp.]